MKVEKHYTKYIISDGDFHLRVKIGDKITLQNKHKGQAVSWDTVKYPENTFLFRLSDPKTIQSFARCLSKAVRLSQSG